MKKLLLSFLLVSAPCVAQPWVPVDCGDRMGEIEALGGERGQKESVQERWQRFEAEVRAQRPGSTVYAPHVFPRRAPEILEDLRYAIDEVMVGDTPLAALSPEHRSLVTGLRQGVLRTEIVRVENWSSSRCSSRRPKPFYHLIRLFDGTEEIARCALHDTGLLAQCGFRTNDAGATVDWTPAEDVAETLRVRLGVDVPVHRVQYVTTDGLPFCSVVSPCIALRSGDRTYLLAQGELLYELDLARAVSVTVHRQRALDALQKGLPRLGDHELEEPEISVGFGWVPARRVSP